MVASPIVVEGRVWGAMARRVAARTAAGQDTEQRLADFTELVATAIANAESRAELTTSRARIVAAADQTRRRIERDLHDGAQQRLVALALQLRAAQAALPPELDALGAQLDRAVAEATGALDELREIASGIHPAILTEGGLGPALRALARRSPIPVDLDLRAAGRLPEQVEVSAYYIVAEALTNAAKHAHASTVTVTVEADTADRPSCCASRSATTASAAPTSPAAPACSASRTASRHSAADHRRQPARGGHHAAGQTPDHRGMAIFLEPDARPAGRPSRGPRHGRPRLFASVVMRPAASASYRRRAHGRRRPIAHSPAGVCSRNGHARSSVVRLRLSLRRFRTGQQRRIAARQGARRRVIMSTPAFVVVSRWSSWVSAVMMPPPPVSQPALRARSAGRAVPGWA